MSPFDLTPNEVRSFQSSFFRFTQIDGPIKLVRFGDTTRAKSGGIGRFWLYGSEMSQILSSHPSCKTLIRNASKRWAICDDWGDMGVVWFMDVPAGHGVPAAWGATQFQPRISTQGQMRGLRQTARSYEGGSLQLIIPVIDTDGVTNPYLKSLISRPITTDKLATAPQRYL